MGKLGSNPTDSILLRPTEGITDPISIINGKMTSCFKDRNENVMSGENPPSIRHEM